MSFSYLSKLEPGNPDGDGDPDTGYGPDYYALFVMKVGQANQAPPDDEWRYLSLQIEPNSITLKKILPRRITIWPYSTKAVRSWIWLLSITSEVWICSVR